MSSNFSSTQFRRTLSLAGILIWWAATAAAQPPVELVPEQAYVEGQAESGEYKEYRLDTAGVQLPIILRVDLEVISGNADIYASENGAPPRAENFTWKSDSPTSGQHESLLLTVTSSAARPRFAVRGYTFCTYRIRAKELEYNSVELILNSGSAEAEAALMPGWIDIYHTSLTAAKLYKVVFDISSATRTELQSRDQVTLRVGAGSEAVLPQPRAGLALPALNTHAGPVLTLSTKRGLDTRPGAEAALGTGLIAYVQGPREVYMSLHAGTEPLREFEDPVIPYSLGVAAQEARAECLGTRLAPVEAALQGSDWHFYSLDVPPAADGFLRLQLLGLDAERGVEDPSAVNSVLAMFVSVTTPYPMSSEDSFFHQTQCRNSRCVLTVELPPLPDPVPAHACGEAPQVFIAVQSEARASQFSKYSLSVLPLDSECGWRPSCASCSAGPDKCTFCRAQGDTPAYCAALDDQAYTQGLCDVAPSCLLDMEEEHCTSGNNVTACECAQREGCGWCGKTAEIGVCAPAATIGDGPAAGQCDMWIEAAPGSSAAAECEGACAVHDQSATALDQCAACAFDPSCGLCVGSAGTFCVAGGAGGPAGGACPADLVGLPLGPGASHGYVYEDAGCVLVSAGAPALPIAAGEVASSTLVAGAAACGLHYCDHAIYDFALDSSQVGDVVVVARVVPATAEVRVVSRRNRRPSRAAADEQAALSQVRDGAAVYTMLVGMCDASLVDSLHFAVFVDGEPGAAVRVQLEVTPAVTEVLVPRGEDAVVLPDQFTCCGAARHYTIKVDFPPDEADHERELSLAVTPTELPPEATVLTMYARQGFCPSSGLHDVNQTQQLDVELSPVALDGLIHKGAANWWLVSVSSTGGLDQGLVRYSLTVEHVDLGTSSSAGIEGWMLVLTICLCVALVLGVIGGVYYYETSTQSSCASVAKDEFTHLQRIVNSMVGDLSAQEKQAAAGERRKDEEQGSGDDDTVPRPIGRLDTRSVSMFEGRKGALGRSETMERKEKEKVLLDKVVAEARSKPDIATLMASIREVSATLSPMRGAGVSTPSRNRAMSASGVPLPPPPPLPPPMPGGRGGLQKRRMSAFGELRRDSSVISEFQALRKESMGPAALRSKDDDDDAVSQRTFGGKSVAESDRGDMLAELRDKSSHHGQVRKEVEEYRSMLEEMAEQIRLFTTHSMPKLVAFRATVESALNNLSDEREVLKEIDNWPEPKMDAIREAASLYTEMTAMKTLLMEFNQGEVKLDAKDFYSQSSMVLEKVQRRVEGLRMSKAADDKRFKANGLPWDPALLEEVSHASLKFGEVFLLQVLTDVASLRSEDEMTVEADEKVKWMLDNAVRIGFRVHQFASGFNDTCTLLFNEVAKLRREFLELPSKAVQEEAEEAGEPAT